MKTVLWVRALVLAASTGLLLCAWLFVNPTGCQLNGPTWWTFMPQLGAGFHTLLLLLLVIQSRRIVPLLATVGLTFNVMILSQHYEYGAMCGSCLLHVGLLGLITIASFGLAPPQWLAWKPVEKMAAVVVPVSSILIGWNTDMRNQFSFLKILIPPKADCIVTEIDPARDPTTIPAAWRQAIKPPCVLLFAGECTTCRQGILDFARKCNISMVTVFSSSEQTIKKELRGYTGAYIADEHERLAQLMNAPPIRVFAVGNNFNIVWAQPRVMVARNINDVVLTAARSLPSKEKN